MELKVVKFGGSSLADAGCFINAASIVKADAARRYVVVSAPGRRGPDDIKITDMLLDSIASDGRDSMIDAVAERFDGIIRGLGLNLSIGRDVRQMKTAAALGRRDFLASRGEYLSAKIMAMLLGYDFLDAGDGILFDGSGRCNWEESRLRMAMLLKHSSHAVIPGFYGSDIFGNVCTFTRGGSDVTGAIVAEAANADMYEKWTDVSGVFASDPRRTPDAKPLDILTYDELRELAHGGAEVMHEDAVLPVKRAGIPICIKNTQRPRDKGTLVVPSRSCRPTRIAEVGIAGI